MKYAKHAILWSTPRMPIFWSMPNTWFYEARQARQIFEARQARQARKHTKHASTQAHHLADSFHKRSKFKI